MHVWNVSTGSEQTGRNCWSLSVPINQIEVVYTTEYVCEKNKQSPYLFLLLYSTPILPHKSLLIVPLFTFSFSNPLPLLYFPFSLSSYYSVPMS